MINWTLCSPASQLKAPAPRSEQPNLDRLREELPEAEQVTFDLFRNEEYVGKLFSFLAMEEDKQTDKFRQFMLKFFKVRAVLYLIALFVINFLVAKWNIV